MGGPIRGWAGVEVPVAGAFEGRFRHAAGGPCLVWEALMKGREPLDGGALPETSQAAAVKNKRLTVRGLHLQDVGDDQDVVPSIEFLPHDAIDPAQGAL